MYPTCLSDADLLVVRSKTTENVPNKELMSSMVTNSLEVAGRNESIGYKLLCLEEKDVAKLLVFLSCCYN